VELWKSDGTTAGTVMVKDINAGAGNSIDTVLPFANVNGRLFFTADDGAHGFELWKSDGTSAGTVMVKDINSGADDSFPFDMTNVNGTLFFAADDGTHGTELWKSDGTLAGTVMIDNIDASSGSSITFAVGNFINVSGTLFFTADDGTHGNELWKSDGTAAGTMMVKDIIPGSLSSLPQDLTNVNGVLEFYASDGTSEGLWRSDGTAAGTIEIASNIDTATPIGFTPAPVLDDFNSDGRTDILWRNANGTLAEWSMNGSVISASSFLTSSGAVVGPGSSWSVAGISDFNGDGRADVLWRNADGTLADWTMNGSTIAASGTLDLGGVAVRPDASWSVAGVGDFDGDSRSDILWRNANGTLADWSMNGSTIMSSGFVTNGGSIVKPDASWNVAGVGDFDGDGRSDILWRNASGEVTAWLMNGSKIAGSGDITFGGAAARPDATWSIAGVGDFNHDGKSDLLWRSANGSLAMWLMNGTTIASSGFVTFNGSAIAPDASWHVVEIGDFNGDSNADILWRNNNGALAEWLMNGNAVAQSLAPTSNGAMVSPDASWSTQAKPTISA
jgi:ELWxxDGT repeat protein